MFQDGDTVYRVDNTPNGEVVRVGRTHKTLDGEMFVVSERPCSISVRPEVTMLGDHDWYASASEAVRAVMDALEKEHREQMGRLTRLLAEDC